MDVFAVGTEVLCLGQVGDEWFAEFVVHERAGKRYVHVMLKCEDVSIEN